MISWEEWLNQLRKITSNPKWIKGKLAVITTAKLDLTHAENKQTR